MDQVSLWVRADARQTSADKVMSGIVAHFGMPHQLSLRKDRSCDEQSKSVAEWHGLETEMGLERVDAFLTKMLLL